jgi:CheY-like chemotaxis protein
VEDTGIGISEEQLPNIFLSFHQVNRQLLHTEGTGLGLAISQRLVKMMGGELCVTSTPGVGSLFWFQISLPQAVQPAEISRKSRMQERRVIGFTGAPPRILIVDDEELNRELLLDILAPLGFTLKEAVDGNDALEKIKTFEPDLILLDLVMSDMDGFQVVECIRQNPAWQAIRVIAVSASAFQQTQERSLEIGCDGFIAKPLRVKDLLEKLHQALPIEWVYEALPEPLKNDRAMPDSLVIPPVEMLRSLYTLAQRGHLRKIFDYLEELEHTNPQWDQFIEKIRTFAKNFHMDQMCQFLERYLEEE